MESFPGRERQTAPGRTRCEGLSQAVSRVEKLSVFPGTSSGFPGRGNHESISLCNERMIPAVYVKPFWDQFWKQRKTENTEGRTMISTWHEGVYHATQLCQAASLSLTQLSLRGLLKACQVESQKNGGFLARGGHDQYKRGRLSGSACMLVLCLLEDGSLIGLVMLPQSKDNPDPDIGKCPYCNRMAFAFGSLALVVVCGPRLAQSGLPGKMMKRIAQRFYAAKASMSLGIHPTLKEHWRGSPQSLQAACVLITVAIIADFCQQ